MIDRVLRDKNMKFRNGFVSNSSSSSYILAYDDRNVIIDPKDIADFIKDNLRENVLFWGPGGEGDDIFELGMNQKNFLLKRTKRFIQFCKGTFKDDVYVQDDSEQGYHWEKVDRPYVRAISNPYRFFESRLDYDSESPDMSDVPEPKDGESWESYYKIQADRERDLWDKKKKECINKVRKDLISKGVDDEHLKIETVLVDNNSCDPDNWSESEFAPRYFGLQDTTYDRDVKKMDFLDEDNDTKGN